MSRIAGIVFAAAGVAPPLLRDRMLPKLPGANPILVTLDGAALGWQGWSTEQRASGLFAHATLQVVLDGQVLNARELRKGLTLPAGDAALIATLYRQNGFEGMLSQLVGDFAVAIYDLAASTLWLGRDRFGVKPLYFVALPSGALAFASQPGALLALPGVSAEPNRAYVARFAGMHYRTFDNAPSESPYRMISQLPAAHFVAGVNGAIGTARAYWTIREQDEWTQSEEVLSEQYRDLLFTAVRRRVEAARKPAFTLSGGLDSSSVLCSAVAVSGRKQAAFSSVYVDATFDERDEIADVVQDKVSSWTPVEIPNQIRLFDIVADMVRVHDEPVATATWLSHFLLTKQVAGAGYDALFGGLGGDELNAGEYEYFPMHFADLRIAGRTAELDEEIQAWARHHDHPIFRKNLQTAKEMMDRMTDTTVRGRCLPDVRRMLRYADTVSSDYFDLSTFIPVMDTPFDSYLKNRTYQDMFRETLPCCLRAEDRQCSAAGMEHFDPFLDHALVEFMYRVPGGLKISQGVTKQLLRGAMTGILPEATRTRIKKTGWNAPAHRWFDGPALEALRDMVGSDSFRRHGVYDPKRVMALIDDHVRIVATGANQENHMMFLWQMLNLELWLEQVDQQK
jgi:asparagine synthase (glutamine-hydrolysing)